jgi:hypothetical protein
MGEIERKQYFAQLFAVDTTEIDKDILACELEAKELRVKIKMYGEIDLTEVKPVDVSLLQGKLAFIRKKYQIDIKNVEEQNKEIRSYNNVVHVAVTDLKRWSEEILTLQKRIRELSQKCNDTEVWLTTNQEKDEIPFLDPPDTSELETKISEAAATNVQAEQYQKNVKQAQEKQTDEKKLLEVEKQRRDWKKVKIAKLADISKSCKIKNLSFDESGNFTYEGTSAGMLSGSQIMKLSEDLSNLYPKDLGIGLIDRAESLGKSVFLLIDRAKEEEKTILATVVGERPAEIPAEVGVWIVEKGEVKK